MQIILFIILTLIVINLLVRLFFRYIIYKSKKRFNNFQNFSNNRSNEGDIKVSGKTKEKKQYSSDAGEYVDFEEVR